MDSLAEAAGMRWGGSGSGQRQWGEIAHERKEQQQSGGQAMHAICANQNPKVGLA
jgi:hypothetical protein